MPLTPTTQRGEAQIKRQICFDTLRKETKWRCSKALKSREAKIAKTLKTIPLKAPVK